MRELSSDRPFNGDLNDDPGLNAGEAEPRVLDGEQEVDKEDNARDDGQYTHRYAGSSLACTVYSQKYHRGRKRPEKEHKFGHAVLSNNFEIILR